MTYQAIAYRLDVVCSECGAPPDPDAPMCDTPLAEDLALVPLYNCANQHHFRVPFAEAVLERGTIEHIGDALPNLTIERQVDVAHDS